VKNGRVALGRAVAEIFGGTVDGIQDGHLKVAASKAQGKGKAGTMYRAPDYGKKPNKEARQKRPDKKSVHKKRGRTRLAAFAPSN